MVDRCPLCGSYHLILDPIRGETYCQDCGLVIKEKMDTVEISTSKNNSVKHINYYVGSHYSTKYELSTLHNKVGKTPREWKYVKDYINTVSSKLYVPKPVQENALKLFLEVYETGILNKKTVTLEGVSLTALFIASRSEGITRVTPPKLIEYGFISIEEFLHSALWVAYSTSGYFNKYNEVLFEGGDFNESEQNVNYVGDD